MSLENDHLETSLYVKPMDCNNYLPFNGEYAVKDRKWQDFKLNCTVKAAQLRRKGYPQTLIWEAYARARDKSRDAPLTYKNRTHHKKTQRTRVLKTWDVLDHSSSTGQIHSMGLQVGLLVRSTLPSSSETSANTAEVCQSLLQILP